MAYRYSIRILKAVAETYLYWNGYDTSGSHRETNQFSISEYLCDFELGLSRLAGKEFVFKGLEFKAYKNYPIYVRVIVADIIGVTEEELIRQRFYDILNLRERAYSKLKECLNGSKL